MHHIPIDLRKSRPKEVNKSGKHWACPQVIQLAHGEPISLPDPVFLACTYYTAPPNAAACLLVKFCIYQRASFPLNSAEEEFSSDLGI